MRSRNLHGQRKKKKNLGFLSCVAYDGVPLNSFKNLKERLNAMNRNRKKQNKTTHSLS